MNRNDVARELATKDGLDYDQLDSFMLNAYLHNADEAIKDRLHPVTEEGEPAPPPFTCMVCEDVGFIQDKPCQECNPVGLVKETNYYKTPEDPPTLPVTLLVKEEVASVTGTEPVDPPAGGGDTSQPEQPSKPAPKKTARSRTR